MQASSDPMLNDLTHKSSSSFPWSEEGISRWSRTSRGGRNNCGHFCLVAPADALLYLHKSTPGVSMLARCLTLHFSSRSIKRLFRRPSIRQPSPFSRWIFLRTENSPSDDDVKTPVHGKRNDVHILWVARILHSRMTGVAMVSVAAAAAGVC